MCGILGYLNPKKNADYSNIIKRLYMLSDNRGKEASGFCVNDKNQLSVYKTPFSGTDLVKGKAFEEFVVRQDENLSIIGHSRLVTDGYEHEDQNNQPVISDGCLAVHNGIIVNHKELWEKHFKGQQKETALDSEFISALGNKLIAKDSKVDEFLKVLFNEVKGVFNTAVFLDNKDSCILASNNGSLYYAINTKGELIFASEKFIVSEIVNEFESLGLKIDSIKQLKANSYLIFSKNGIVSSGESEQIESNIELLEIDKKTINHISGKKYLLGVPKKNTSMEYNSNSTPEKFKLHFSACKTKVDQLKRCSKCLLPETFPYISYDNKGECNYCLNYNKNKVTSIADFKEVLSSSRLDKSREPKCLVPFSGGRDSSYGLHYLVKELGLKPIAFSYDWGMLTDLSRRNQALMCGELGVEHILISADIRKKRDNIRKNVLAWLKRPSLGTIPLFMAGDKQYFYFANLLMKQNKLDVSIMGENMLETTMFKSGFCGIKPKFEKGHTYSLSMGDKMKMMAFYGKEYLLNPSYINSSILDTLDAFKSYYVMDHKNLNLFDYLKWNETEVNNTLLNQYNWETDPETKSTWRIGDGTAAFYNYIYYVVAGFTENDTFRSNQIREGQISREEGLRLLESENYPRWNSIQWYCNTINIDWEVAIETINKIPKLFES